MNTRSTAPAHTNIFPLVYEINTRCWLHELAAGSNKPLTLAEIPESEFEHWRSLGFTHIWLMGVWQVGPLTRAHSLKHRASLAQGEALPARAIVGSPYAIAGYTAAPSLGGDTALKHFRDKLHAHGLKLLLDFIPNHLGLDHPWLMERPELFVRGRARTRGTFPQRTRHGLRWIAHGRDPYFAPWTDTAQLDYRNPATHAAMLEELRKGAGLCDGVRCDMAMLVLPEVFRKTWEKFNYAGADTQEAFWPDAIAAIKSSRPDFLFLAESYWGLESRLQQLGFDFTYDKIFYDHLVAGSIAKLQQHLLEATPGFLAASAHFLENHDEARIASILSPPEQACAALLLLGLPGLRLLHDGQLSGLQKRVNVHLGRRPVESPDPKIVSMYANLLPGAAKSGVGRGEAAILRPKAAWEENQSAQNFVLVQWHSGGDAFDLVVVNLANHPSQCYAPLQLPRQGPRSWNLRNRLGPETFLRDARSLARDGLFLDLPAWTGQLFHCTPE